MVSTLDDPKRLTIATQLAGMKALQNLLINNEQQLLQDCAMVMDSAITHAPSCVLILKAGNVLA